MILLAIALLFALAGYTTIAIWIAWIVLGLGVATLILQGILKSMLLWIQKREPDFTLDDLDNYRAKYKQPQDHKKSTKKK